MRTVCIVQQRMASTRLPGKALLPLAGKSLTQNLLERVKRATKLDAVVLAVPATPENECLWQVAHDAGCEFYWYSGEEHDLVGRYLAAAKCFNADIIVRVPGDNPCVEYNAIDAAIDEYLRVPYSFYSNTTAQVGSVAVDGIGAEVFSLSRLKWLDRITAGSAIHREHPHRYFEECQHEYGNGVHFWNGGAAVRLDVNDQDDYDFIAEIYSHFGHNRFTVEEVLGYLDSKVSVG